MSMPAPRLMTTVERQPPTGRPLLVGIVGIDGCGKTSLQRAVLEALAANHRVAGVGDAVVSGGDGEPLRERPDLPGAPLTQALGRFAKGIRWQALYGNLKVLELAERSRLRRLLADRERPAVIVTDGDPLINTAAWAAARFYPRELADDTVLLTVLKRLSGEQPPRLADLPGLLRRGWQLAVLSLLGLARFGQPDLVAWLRIEPATALRRIQSRGKPLQAHETEAVLAQLDQAYGRVCRLLELSRGVPVLCIDVDRTTKEEAVQQVVDRVSQAQVASPEPAALADIEVIATTISGSIQDQAKIDFIEPEFRARTSRSVHLNTVNSHAAAREVTHDLVARGARLLVSAGGAGTFNAVLEGAHLQDGPPSDLRLAFLRKGSADLLGKALGIPDALPAAVQAIIDGIEARQEVPADILEVEVASLSGEAQVRHFVGFGGFGVFGEIPRFTETRVVKLYKGILGSLFGDLGPFFVGLPLAVASWQLQRLLGRVPPSRLRLDAEALPLDTWSAVLVLNGDLGKDFPLGRGLALGSGGFRVVALRYRGLRNSLRQIVACRDGRVLQDPPAYDAVVRTVGALEMDPGHDRAYMINVDGLRLHGRGPAAVRVSGRIRLIANPRQG
jgi:diacylglycerol kinase family enzyme